MCDSAQDNWNWTVRDRQTGKPVTTKDGYAYYFADESSARELAAKFPRRDLELVQVREPGA